MKTTARERAEVMARLVKLGVAYEDAEALRSIAGTLRNWFELECGTGTELVSRSIERDEREKPFMRTSYHVNGVWQERKQPVADREAGARKQLAKIMTGYPELVPFVQTDCRGPAIYVLMKTELEGVELGSCYNRGVAVY